MSSTAISKGSLIYLHFILLLYDICCATQNCSPDGIMWSQHFQQLARLAYAGDDFEFNELQAYILWYTLFLDAQSCLSGNPESGFFVRAYLSNGSTLPTWRKPEGSTQQPNLEIAGLSAVTDLSKYMCGRFAQLSQLALQMREDVEAGRGSITEHQNTVVTFRNEMYSNWSLKYPAFLPRDSPEAGTRLPTLARTVFDFVSLDIISFLFVFLFCFRMPGQKILRLTIFFRHLFNILPPWYICTQACIMVSVTTYLLPNARKLPTIVATFSPWLHWWLPKRALNNTTSSSLSSWLVSIVRMTTTRTVPLVSSVQWKVQASAAMLQNLASCSKQCVWSREKEFNMVAMPLTLTGYLLPKNVALDLSTWGSEVCISCTTIMFAYFQFLYIKSFDIGEGAFFFDGLYDTLKTGAFD